MIVVDSSVALKWLALESDSDKADALLGEKLVAPSLILAECANALWKKVRKNEIQPAEALRGLALLDTYVELRDATPYIPTAFVLGVELGHPIYDCVFLAMAGDIDAPLISADVRFIRRCAGGRFETRVVAL